MEFDNVKNLETARRHQKRHPPRPRITSPVRPITPADTNRSKPVSIDFAGPNHRFESADLEILGIDHSQSSYEGRAFFNNPEADANTPKTIDHGYAGSFYIFGHGGCFGSVGHCDVTERLDAYDFRDPHPLAPTLARVPVTAALKQFAKSNSVITITVVPVVSRFLDGLFEILGKGVSRQIFMRPSVRADRHPGIDDLFSNLGMQARGLADFKERRLETFVLERLEYGYGADRES